MTILRLLWPSGYILLFWCAVLAGCAWMFKSLLQASAVPEFGAGLVGGALWGIIVSCVWQAIGQSCEEFNLDMKRWQQGE